MKLFLHRFLYSFFLIPFCGNGAAQEPTSGGRDPGGETKNLAKNPGFELQSVLSDSARGKWTLPSDGRAPDHWRLSTAFPGELEVLESDAPEGRRFIRVTAGKRRAAHIYQSRPQMVRRRVYKISLHHQGGPAKLRMYEYDAEGNFVGEPVLAKGDASPSGLWRETVGYYMMPKGVVRTSLAIEVPPGGTTGLDDLRMVGFERSSEKLDVRDFGASGSSYKTLGDTTAGSPLVVVENTGDFEVGQEVAVSRCNPHFSDGRVWSVSIEGSKEENFRRQVELRGYDGSAGKRAPYILDFKGESPPTFRWSDDLGQSWTDPIEATGGWQKLNAGIEVRLANPEFWSKPRLLSFTARDHLFSRIEKIEGQTLTLAHPVPLAAEGCVVQHSDSGALQRAFDRAVGEGRNIHIPSGHYRLDKGLVLDHADGITIEGENESNTIFELSNGQGACITVNGGGSITFRRLAFRGFSGFAEMKKMGFMRAQGYPHMWGFFAQHCNAITFRSPERVLVENCHASGMSAECFYSGSASRKGNEKPPTHYQKAITYRDCTVSDCARNAFNNNDFAENTSVLNCRIENIGGCAWEGASRFVKFMGNYVTNAGPVAMGNIRSRAEHFDILPSAQHIVSNNTFEGTLAYGNSYVTASAGATPVIISNNVFVNLNASAIKVSGHGDARNLPAGNVIITGNAIDLTCVSGESRERVGITASTNDSTISDNQIYTRKGIDPKTKGILLAEPAHHLSIHDNTIRNCQTGMEAIRIKGRVGELLDSRTFQSTGRMPWPRRDRYRYQGYQIVWMPNASKPDQLEDGPVIETFDPDKGAFRLREDAKLKPNAVFVLRAPQGFSWNIHHNIISDCAQAVKLDVFGGATAVFSDNLLQRSGNFGGAESIPSEVHGQFTRRNNLYSGVKKPAPDRAR